MTLSVAPSRSAISSIPSSGSCRRTSTCGSSIVLRAPLLDVVSTGRSRIRARRHGAGHHHRTAGRWRIIVKSARTEAAAIMERAERAHALNFNQPDAAGNQFVVNLSSLQEDNTRTVRSTLLTVLAAALCLLLIAAMNVGVLLFGQGLKRRNEVAVRHAVGAGRARLVRQFMTESLALSTVAASWLSDWRRRRCGCSWRRIRLGRFPRTAFTWIFALRLSPLSPWRLRRSWPVLCLRSGCLRRPRPRAPKRRRRSHDRACAASATGMLVAQIAVSTVLLVCAALLRTVIQLRAEPFGFLADGLKVAEVALPTTPFDSNGLATISTKPLRTSCEHGRGSALLPPRRHRR